MGGEQWVEKEGGGELAPVDCHLNMEEVAIDEEPLITMTMSHGP